MILKWEPDTDINADINRICEIADVEKSMLMSGSRKRELADSRAVLARYWADVRRMRYEQIGLILGNRDHSTVSCMVKKTTEVKQVSALYNQFTGIV